MFYEDVFRVFGKGTAIFSCGGIAVDLHDVPRATTDLDMVIDLEGFKKIMQLKK
jgi:hypothetical protein